jgi:thioredoxin 1
MTPHVTDETFAQEVLQSEVPVLVDFYADWCGPCKALGPVIADVEAEVAGKVKVVKLDVDSSGKTATQYKVHGIPTLLVFKGGQKVAEHVGYTSKEEILALLNV